MRWYGGNPWLAYNRGNVDVGVRVTTTAIELKKDLLPKLSFIYNIYILQMPYTKCLEEEDDKYKYILALVYYWFIIPHYSCFTRAWYHLFAHLSLWPAILVHLKPVC